MRRIGLAVTMVLTLMLVPLGAEGQEAAKVWRIGGLADLGWIEGKNIRIENQADTGIR